MAPKRAPKPVSTQVSGHAESTSSLPAAAVLRFLKEARGMPSWSWNLEDPVKPLRISTAEAKRAIALLEVQGYIERTGYNEWLMTDSGAAVSGSRPARFTQQAVSSALSGLAERIKAANQDPDAAFRVAKAVAFGDFLSDRARVQAADVGIQFFWEGPRVP